MGDWVKVMENFRDVVLRDAPQPRTLSGQHPNIQLALLRSLVQTVSTQKKAKILTNLLAAAMHLAFLKSAVQNKLALELPDDPLALVHRRVSSSSIASKKIVLTLNAALILCQVTMRTSLMMRTSLVTRK